LDSDPAGCTTLAASLSFISCFGLRCDCAELITFSTLGSAFDPSRYDTTQDRSLPSEPRFANPTGQPRMFVKPEPRMPPTTRLLTRQAVSFGKSDHLLGSQVRWLYFCVEMNHSDALPTSLAVGEWLWFPKTSSPFELLHLPASDC
jgi:hypothetical protein